MFLRQANAKEISGEPMVSRVLRALNNHIPMCAHMYTHMHTHSYTCTCIAGTHTHTCMHVDPLKLT